jgi:hypothetical protein
METENMAVSKKTRSKNIDSDKPVSPASEDPAAATATATPSKKKTVARKAAAS